MQTKNILGIIFSIIFIGAFAFAITWAVINQEKVKEHMKQLQDVPEGLERCFDTITELYDSYGALTDLAIEPTGSYTSFTDAVNSAVNDFSSAYKKLESQIPAKK